MTRVRFTCPDCDEPLAGEPGQIATCPYCLLTQDAPDTTDRDSAYCDGALYSYAITRANERRRATFERNATRPHLSSGRAYDSERATGCPAWTGAAFRFA